jgi:hypothetical protein
MSYGKIKVTSMEEIRNIRTNLRRNRNGGLRPKTKCTWYIVEKTLLPVLKLA